MVLQAVIDIEAAEVVAELQVFLGALLADRRAAEQQVYGIDSVFRSFDAGAPSHGGWLLCGLADEFSSASMHAECALACRCRMCGKSSL